MGSEKMIGQKKKSEMEKAHKLVAELREDLKAAFATDIKEAGKDEIGAERSVAQDKKVKEIIKEVVEACKFIGQPLSAEQILTVDSITHTMISTGHWVF